MKTYLCYECGKHKTFTNEQFKKIEVVLCEACLVEMEVLKDD